MPPKTKATKKKKSLGEDNMLYMLSSNKSCQRRGIILFWKLSEVATLLLRERE